MTKICFITTIPTTLESFVLNTAKYIHENTDWDISFICSYEEAFAKNLPSYIHFYPVQMERGISISGIKSMLQMLRIFKREKFDLIQYSTPNASLYASLAGFLSNIPIRLYCQWGMVFVGFDGIKRLIFKLEEKLVCKLSTWIEPDSKSNLDFARSEKLYSSKKSSVVWNGSACGINLNKFDINQKASYRIQIRNQFGLKSSDFIFGFVGRITRDKGINELFTAFKAFVSKNPDTYLLMVGSLEIDKTVDKTLYEWAQNSPNVIFSGRTNVVEQYLSAMDCFILPSYREGFGMGVVEAEAMGVPVIVTNIPGPINAMVPGQTGEIIEKKNPKALYSAMKHMRSTDDLLDYGINGHNFVMKNFEQMQFMEKIVEDRKRLINNTN